MYAASRRSRHKSLATADTVHFSNWIHDLHTCADITAEGENDGTSIASLLSYLRSDEEENEREREASDEAMFTPSVIKRQLAMFASENQQPQTADTLTWWQENDTRFRSLATLARKYLAIPATSAPSERVFSLAGNICNRRRACLSPAHLDALVFLNANSDLLVD
jgi:hAT family C-terminal dimerisation region